MFDVISLMLLFVVVAATLLYTYVRGSNKLPTSIIGPDSSWLLGNVLDMRSSKRILTMEEWARRYGPVFSIKVFNQARVVVSGYEELVEMLNTKGRSFGGKPQTFRLNMVFKGKDILFANSVNDQFSPMRKAAHRAIRHYGDGMNRLESILCTQMADFVRAVREYKGKEVDLRDDIYNFVIKVTATMQSGRLAKQGDDILLHIKRLEIMRDTVSPMTRIELDWFPWLRHFGHPIFKKIDQGIAILDELWKKMQEMAADTYSSEGEPTCTVNAIRQLGDPKSPNYEPSIDDEHMKGLFLDLFLASMQTTATSAYSLLNILLHHEEVLKTLREEVDRIVGEDRMPSIRDREAMPYACATILELLRYTSTAPVGVRETQEDTSVGGHSIPAHTIVYPFYWALHHDEKFWGDPWAFRPERFLDDDGSLLPADHPRRKHLMPFGSGFRVCVGEVFAMKRLFIFLTSLVQAFDLKAGERDVSCDPRTYAAAILMTHPPYGIKLIPRRA